MYSTAAAMIAAAAVLTATPVALAVLTGRIAKHHITPATHGRWLTGLSQEGAHTARVIAWFSALSAALLAGIAVLLVWTGEAWPHAAIAPSSAQVALGLIASHFAFATWMEMRRVKAVASS